MEVKLEQVSKTSDDIIVKEVGSETFNNFEFPENAPYVECH